MVSIGITAYTAGFFDGEGCITGRLRPTGSVRVAIVVSQVNPRPLRVLKVWYGGGIFYVEAQQIYTWQLTKKSDVRKFLEAILPFLIVKKNQAIVALQMLETPATDHKKQQDLREQLSWLKTREAANVDLKTPLL